MKLKIELETPPMGVLPLKALQNALKRPETSELISAYGPGDSFSMNDDRQGIKITFTVIEK